jgi:hypothetical protein
MFKFIRIFAFLILGCSQAFAAVTFDACGTNSSNVSPLTSNNQTVGAGLTNGILTVILVMGTSTTPPVTFTSVQWDTLGTPQNMTVVPGFPFSTGNQSIYAFYLLNPHAGNLRFAAIWTGGGTLDAQLCSFQGASGVANANSTIVGGAPQTVAITAGANDMVFGGFSSTSNFTSTGATQVNIDNTQAQWAIAWQRASGPNPTLTGNPGPGLSAGFSITASGGGGPACNGGLLLRGAGGC